MQLLHAGGRYEWLPRADLLTFEEIGSARRRLLVGLGVDRLRLTGGEPLLRRDLPALVAPAGRPAAIATSRSPPTASCWRAQIQSLRDAGLGRVTVSLDTLQRDRFIALARLDAIDAVTAGIAAGARGLARSKSTRS